MTNVLAALELILSLVQLANESLAAIGDLKAAIDKARSEGRDLTDAELDTIRQTVMDARNRLTG